MRRLLPLLLLVGCARVDPARDYDRARAAGGDAMGIEFPAPNRSATDRSLSAEPWVADGLTVVEAVRVALLENPTLQAAFLEIGVARADLVQSSLLSNPTLSLSLQFPEGGGRSNLQASLAQSIVELWQIPVRKRIADEALERAILVVADRAVQLGADVRFAYYGAVAARVATTIANENVSLTHRLLDVATIRRQAGAVGDLDVNLARANVINAEIEVDRAELESASARLRLAELLGLALRPEELKLVDGLPAPPAETLGEDGVVALARSSRLDLRAAERSVRQAALRIEVEFRRIVPSFEIGPFLERGEGRAQGGRTILADAVRASVAAGEPTAPEIEPASKRRAERSAEIDVILGPALSVTLPIFDQNQARIAVARFEFERAIHQRDALELSAVQAVRAALLRTATASRIARKFTGELIPTAEKNVEMASESYRAGRTAVVVVLDAQRGLLDARRQSVEAMHAAASSLIELERAVSRPLSVICAVGSNASTQAHIAAVGRKAIDPSDNDPQEVADEK